MATANNNDDADRITIAVADFRREMRTSNKAFLEAEIKALNENQNQTLTERQRLDKLAPYFDSSLRKWPTSGYDSDLTSPQELLAEDRIEDGTVPPVSKEEREQYLAVLMPLLQEAAAARENNFVVEPPTEFITFLTLANGITDPSFVKMQFPSMEGTSYPITRDSISDMKPGQREWYDYGWHVITGWQCGYGTATGATLLLYAYKYSGGTEEEQTPQWRVHTWNQMHSMWFPSIADFVCWRSQRLQRVPGRWQDGLPARDDSSDESSQDSDDEDDE